jgi:hypothetical protein
MWEGYQKEYSKNKNAIYINITAAGTLSFVFTLYILLMCFPLLGTILPIFEIKAYNEFLLECTSFFKSNPIRIRLAPLTLGILLCVLNFLLVIIAAGINLLFQIIKKSNENIINLDGLSLLDIAILLGIFSFMFFILGEAGAEIIPAFILFVATCIYYETKYKDK